MEQPPPQPDLARMRVDGDAEGLCEALRSGDDMTASMAVALLGDLADPSAADALIAYLESPGKARGWNFEVTVTALGRLREPRAVPALLRSLGTEREVEQEAAVLRALAAIGGPEAVRALVDRLTDEPASPAVLDALAELRPPEAVHPLLVALWVLLPGDAVRAVQVLGELRDPRAGPALLFLAHAQDSPVDLRRAAVEALCALPRINQLSRPGRHHEHLLLRALCDPDRETAHAAAQLLSRTHEGRHQLWGVLRIAVYDPRSPHAPPSAVLAVCGQVVKRPKLGDSRSGEDNAALVKLLRAAPTTTVRRASAAALGALGGEQTVDALLAALGDERIVEAVASEVSRLRAPPVGELLTLLADGGEGPQRWGAAVALGLLGSEEATPLLLAALDEEEPPKLRTAAADALGALRHRPAAERLAALAADEAEPGTLRAHAVRALGLIGAPESLPVLLACACSAKEPVRLRAVDALGEFPSPEAAEALGVVVARDANREAARAALHALGRIGAPAAPVLVSLSGQLRTDVAGELIAALAGCEGPEVDAALGQLARTPHPDEIHAAVADALGGRHSPESAASLGVLLADEHRYFCTRAALRALARLGTEEAAEHVLAYGLSAGYYFEEEVREALSALAEGSSKEPRHAGRGDSAGQGAS
ncbi:HEAT repeat domain-containing protein [Streptomyces sp. NPDC057302]|uniref:HEAT repeat domain-containing protein n=1 Tax=Streptomyces sp. NPDC057302 TaxID=3346094 RepID=UPI003642ECE8